MKEKIKSSEEILKEFFDDLSSRMDIDKSVRDTIVQLYKDNKLTENTLNENLEKLRESGFNEN
ncbi:TPA: hypothetical protein ACJT8N_002056 [Legionella pneumophila]|nr:hypothetical protein [Legionella pneumophila]